MKREAHNKGKKAYKYCTECNSFVLKTSLVSCKCNKPKTVVTYLSV